MKFLLFITLLLKLSFLFHMELHHNRVDDVSSTHYSPTGMSIFFPRWFLTSLFLYGSSSLPHWTVRYRGGECRRPIFYVSDPSLLYPIFGYLWCILWIYIQSNPIQSWRCHRDINGQTELVSTPASPIRDYTPAMYDSVVKSTWSRNTRQSTYI